MSDFGFGIADFRRTQTCLGSHKQASPDSWECATPTTRAGDIDQVVLGGAGLTKVIIIIIIKRRSGINPMPPTVIDRD